MKTKMKRALALLLTATMIVSGNITALTAFAGDSAYPSEDEESKVRLRLKKTRTGILSCHRRMERHHTE